MQSSNELTAADIMQVAVKTVLPSLSLPELEEEFLAAGVGGFPVVEKARQLIGIVSRSDVIRAICSERELASSTSDFYRDETGFHEVKMESFKKIADRVGERIEGMTAKDVMVTKPHRVTTSQAVVEIANLFIQHHVHRLPVVEGGDIVGIVTTLDLVRLIEQRRLK